MCMYFTLSDEVMSDPLALFHTYQWMVSVMTERASELGYAFRKDRSVIVKHVRRDLLHPPIPAGLEKFVVVISCTPKWEMMC